MRLCLFASLLLVACAHGGLSEKPQTAEQRLALAKDILRRTPLVDGHNDLPWTLRYKFNSDLSKVNLKGKIDTDTDIPRLREGGVGGQFWSVYIPVGEAEKKEGYAKVQLEQIELARRMIESYPEDLQFVTTVAEARKAMANGKIASFLGMEGGHAIENSLGALRSYYRLGVRYMTLTHYQTIDWADSATDKARHQGLTTFGLRVIDEMNRLGMMVDLSHVSAKVMHQSLDRAKAPVIFSHSSAFAINAHPRNVPDDVLKRMKANGGVVMVTFVTSFISPAVKEWSDKTEKLAAGAKKPPRPDASVEQVADHVDHVRKIAGIDHVGIGGDYYGQDHTVKGLEDVSGYPRLFAELIKRGWTRDELEKLAHKNILRVMEKVEEVSQTL